MLSASVYRVRGSVDLFSDTFRHVTFRGVFIFAKSSEVGAVNLYPTADFSLISLAVK